MPMIVMKMDKYCPVATVVLNTWKPQCIEMFESRVQYKKVMVWAVWGHLFCFFSFACVVGVTRTQ